MVSPFEIEEIFPDVAAGSRLPRRQEANSAQGLAATLVADYTLPTRAWLPTAAIVTLLGESGVSAAGARAAISRLARRGVLESARHGRHSAYRLTPEAAAELSAGGAWIARFGTQDDPWDGRWTLVAFSLPQEQSSPRRTLRGQLRWLGFAPLYDGLWVSPDTVNPTVRQRLSAVSLGAMTIFRADHVELATATNRSPIEAWDIAAIARHYESFDRRWSPLLPSVRAGRVTGAAAVRARAEIMDTYRRIPLLDPHLPIELMSPDWPRVRTRETFTAVYDGLAEQAEEHVRMVVGRSGDRAGTGIRAHTVARMSTL